MVAMTRRRVRAVVLNWNDVARTEQCLNRLLASEGVEVDTLVVDNASAGDDVHRLRERLGAGRVLQLPENRGYAGGMDAGLDFWLAEGGEDPILLVTPDAAVAPDAVRLLLDEMDREPGVGVAGPVMYYGREPGAKVHAGGRVEPRRVRAGLVARTSGAPVVDADYVDGCCMLVRPAAIPRGVRFDPDYFLYFEEIDFCERVLESGWRVSVVQEAEVDHPKRIGGQPPHFFYYMARNRYRFWKKNHGIGFPCVAVQLAGETFRAWASAARAAVVPARRVELRDRMRDAKLHTRGVVQGTRDHLAGRAGRMPDGRMG
jgi:GT2 family glycosyltransferase